MDDGIFSPAAIYSPSFASDMDFEYMNELLGEGCWLETVQGGSDSGNLLNSQFLLSPSDTFLGENIFGQLEDTSREQFLMSSLPESSFLEESKMGREQEIESLDGIYGQPTELGRRWWIGPPNANPKVSPVMERLVRAIRYIKDSSKDKDMLIQIWVPIDLNGKRVLTTNDQPYSVDPSSASLASYRNISLDFQFSAEKNSNIAEGMPGRVFLGKVPEWTPDVRFFRSDEYSRVGYALTHNVRGTLALPVFDRGSQACLGVIEVVTTKQTVKAELDGVCKALEAVDLSSVERESTQKAKQCIHSYRAAIPEILEVMKTTCLAHKLPLAQTWMPCIQQGKRGCRHSNENYIHCVSTVDAASFVANSNVHGFHEACSEHHLLRGQGVAGKAFTTNEPCFFDDITSFSKTDYPLSHHARMFGLHAAVAIRLRSVQTGDSDFVLEFFLPTDCRTPAEHKKMLGSLSSTIQNSCKTLRVVSEDELANGNVTSVSSSGFGAPKMNQEMSTMSGCVSVTDQSCNVAPAPFIRKEEPAEFMYEETTIDRSSSLGSSFVRNTDGSGDNKRSKTEKSITLEVLQRHFSGSLKDAAKRLGVCPTTLKRICRSEGIKRWPSRKIKKVGHSLQKLQRVIDSVQGPSSTFQIGSFYSNFPELASPPSSKSGLTNAGPESYTLPLDGNAASTNPQMTSKSPSSSFSQSSSSSHSSSSASHYKTSTEGSLKTTRTDDSEILTQSQNVGKEHDGTRVKVTYGDDKIRIRMQKHWQLKDLRREIDRRFNVACSSEMQLKYMDDDSEWVLLTCDADWDECLEVSLPMSGNINTIKLSLHAPHHHHLVTSLANSRPP